jgi:hypothetical protein
VGPRGDDDEAIETEAKRMQAGEVDGVGDDADAPSR